MTFRLSTASEDKLLGVHPDLVKVVHRAIELTTVDFKVVQGNRTQSEQDELYAQGRTKPGKIVTLTRHSRHIGGHAVDLAAWINGAISWDEKFYPPIASAMKTAAKELGVQIIWGGNWTSIVDLPHFELDAHAYP